MRTVVPYAVERPKTRLTPVLSAAERRAFSAAMLADVLAALSDLGRSPEVLATGPVDADAPVTVDDRSLSAAVNAVLCDDVPAAVVMADLALATPDALSRLYEGPGDVVIAPGRAGGTNALLVRHPDFRVDYHGASYLDHLRIARAAGASVRTVDSHRLATDIDESDDLVELLVHGEGEARDWLADAGFELDIREGRVGIDRQ